MEHQNTNTIKCYCHELRDLADKTVHIKKRKKSSIYFIFISLTLFIILMCVTIYFICIVQKLSANYEQTLRKINDLQTDMFSLKQKYKQMERRLKASKEMFYDDANSHGFAQNNFGEEVDELAKEIAEVGTDLQSSSRIPDAIRDPLIRNKRRAKKNKKKKCRVRYLFL